MSADMDFATVEPGGGLALHAEPEARMSLEGGLLRVVALAAFVAACSAGAQPAAEGKATEQRVQRGQTVTVVEATKVNFARRISLTGEVRPRDDVRVNAPTSGVRIARLLVEEGDYVRAGQPLAVLDTQITSAQVRTADASLTRARASIRQAEIQSAQADRELARAESVRGEGVLSDEAIEQRRTQAEIYRAQLELARADIEVARAQKDETVARVSGGRLLAPTSGRVIERNAYVGQLVDGQSLFRLVGSGRLEVAAEAPDTELVSMTPGLRARFDLPGGGQVTATLRRVPASVDVRTRTGRAMFDLAGDGKALVGMFVRGEAELPARESVAVPVGAIGYDGGKPVVFVVGANNRVKKTFVKLGPQTGGMVAIDDGLAAGAKVAAGGVAFLQDNDPVQVSGS
jgi:HlyD family secretion protein